MAEHNDRDSTFREILLISNILVGGEQELESGIFGCFQQFTVVQCVPSKIFCILDCMSCEKRGQRRGSTLVEKNQHQRRTGTSRLRAAKSSTAMTCSRVTPNHSMMFSMVAPDSRFSKTVATGMRVPRNTHAPLTLPGTLSTAGHCDQSIAAIANLQGGDGR